MNQVVQRILSDFVCYLLYLISMTLFVTCNKNSNKEAKTSKCDFKDFIFDNSFEFRVDVNHVQLWPAKAIVYHLLNNTLIMVKLYHGI